MHIFFIDNSAAVSLQSFLVHLCFPSIASLFPLTASSIASLNQSCQVYNYNDISGSEFDWEKGQSHYITVLCTTQGMYSTVHFISVHECYYKCHMQSTLIPSGKVML